MLFRVISGLAFGFSLFTGVLTSADSLSEEKREGTLGLLFLTDLRGYDVILGKLAATSLNSFYRLLSVLPILAVPLLLGGALTLGDLGRMALVLANTLFFSLAAGIVVSAISRSERKAMLATLALILLVTAGPPLIGLALFLENRTVPYNLNWLLGSAGYPAVLAFDAIYQLKFRQFWLAVGVTHVLSWLFLLLAAIAVRRVWQDRPAVTSGTSWRERWRAWQFCHGSGGAAFRRRLLDLNPIYWLSARDRLRSIYVLVALATLAGLWSGLYFQYRSSVLDSSVYLLMAYAAHTLLKIWAAFESCRPLAEERQTGGLELLLSTPLPVSEMLEGQMLALKRHFGWPVTIVLAADIVMLVAGGRDDVFDPSREWLLLWLALMIMFVADLFTIAWVGLWLSLTAKRAGRAVTGTIARVLVLPWIVFVLGLSLLAFMRLERFNPSELTLLGGAFGLAMIVDIILIAWAGTNLRERFRDAAAQRFEAIPAAPGPGPMTAGGNQVVPPVLAQ
ncbi:MAG: ABC transporter permease subunit [Verrucomicrobiota bacterium]